MTHTPESDDIVEGDPDMGKHRKGEALGTVAQQKAEASKNEAKVVKAVTARGNTQQQGS